MIEVELKAALTAGQVRSMEEKLTALGFRPDRTVREIDVYLNGGPERDFRRTDEALRLRTCRDLTAGTEETLMTYKGPKLDSRSSTRTEYETTVGSLETARELLAALGFTAAYTVDKERQTMLREEITVCLDRVAGLGPYLELEILQASGSQEQAVEDLLHLLADLEISEEALTRKSYLELLMVSAMEKKSS